MHIPDPQSEYHMRSSLAKNFTEHNGSEIATVVSPLVHFVKSQTGSFSKSKMTSWLGARKQKEPYKNNRLFKKQYIPGFSKKSGRKRNRPFIVVQMQMTNSPASQIQAWESKPLQIHYFCLSKKALCLFQQFTST